MLCTVERRWMPSQRIVKIGNAQATRAFPIFNGTSWTFPEVCAVCWKKIPYRLLWCTDTDHASAVTVKASKLNNVAYFNILHCASVDRNGLSAYVLQTVHAVRWLAWSASLLGLPTLEGNELILETVYLIVSQFRTKLTNWTADMNSEPS